jgi:CBS domain-containing protein
MTTMTRTRTVGELMTRDVLTVPETMTASELARFLSEHEISGAPVVGPTGTLVGVVSTADLARLASENVDWSGEERQSFYRTTPLDDEVMAELYGLEGLAQAPPDGSDTQVRDIMSPLIQSVSEDTTVAAVARLMLAGHYHRLLVTRDDAVAGIVTSLDLLALLAEEED